MAQHWAVKVGYHLIEVAAISKPGKANQINFSKYIPETFSESLYGSVFTPILVGSTLKTDSDIKSWFTSWQNSNPNYNFMTGNCQKFAIELIMWLTDYTAKLPPMQAGSVEISGNPSAFAVSRNGESKVTKLFRGRP